MNPIMRLNSLSILGAATTCRLTIALDHPVWIRNDNSTYRQHDEWKAVLAYGRRTGIAEEVQLQSEPPAASAHKARMAANRWAKILTIQDGTTVSVRHAPRNQQLSRDEHPQWMHPADLLIGCLGQQEMPGLNRRALGAFLGFSVHGFSKVHPSDRCSGSQDFP